MEIKCSKWDFSTSLHKLSKKHNAKQMERNSLSHQFQGKDLSGKLNYRSKHWQTVSDHETVRNKSCLNKSNNPVSKMQDMSFRCSNSPPEIHSFPKKYWAFARNSKVLFSTVKSLIEVIIDLFDILIYFCSASVIEIVQLLHKSPKFHLLFSHPWSLPDKLLEENSLFAVNRAYLIQDLWETMHFFWTIGKACLHKNVQDVETVHISAGFFLLGSWSAGFLL